MIPWEKITKEESDVVTKIGRRASNAFKRLHGRHLKASEQLGVEMDVMAVHLSGCPLRLDDLLTADEFNFCHDVFGITNCIDRSTGKLRNNFLPRFACPRQEAANA